MMARKPTRMKVSLGSGPHLAIGLMSGTSHDGVSAALVRIDERRRPAARLLAFKTYPYSAKFRRRLMRATSAEPVGSGEISALNFGLGRAFAHAAVNLARSAGTPLQRISFIGSHGHTFLDRKSV